MSKADYTLHWYLFIFPVWEPNYHKNTHPFCLFDPFGLSPISIHYPVMLQAILHQHIHSVKLRICGPLPFISYRHYIFFLGLLTNSKQSLCSKCCTDKMKEVGCQSSHLHCYSCIYHITWKEKSGAVISKWDHWKPVQFFCTFFVTALWKSHNEFQQHKRSPSFFFLSLIFSSLASQNGAGSESQICEKWKQGKAFYLGEKCNTFVLFAGLSLSLSLMLWRVSFRHMHTTEGLKRCYTC